MEYKSLTDHMHTKRTHCIRDCPSAEWSVFRMHHFTISNIAGEDWRWSAACSTLFLVLFIHRSIASFLSVSLVPYLLVIDTMVMCEWYDVNWSGTPVLPWRGIIHRIEQYCEQIIITSMYGVKICNVLWRGRSYCLHSVLYVLPIMNYKRMPALQLTSDRIHVMIQTEARYLFSANINWGNNTFIYVEDDYEIA